MKTVGTNLSQWHLCTACNHYTDNPLKHLAKCKKLQNLIAIEKTIEELRSTK